MHGSLRRSKWQTIALLALIASIALPSTASAGPLITYNFSGPVISTVIPGFPTSFTGSFTFDTSTPDSDLSPTVGSYVGALTSFSIYFGNSAFVSTGTTAGSITVTDSGGGQGFFEIGPVTSFSGSFNGYSLNYLKMIDGFSGSGDSLSNISYFLTNAPYSAVFQADFYNPSLSVVIGGITNATPGPSPVPEPSSVFLLAAGVVVALVTRHRRRQGVTERSAMADQGSVTSV